MRSSLLRIAAIVGIVAVVAAIIGVAVRDNGTPSPRLTVNDTLALQRDGAAQRAAAAQITDAPAPDATEIHEHMHLAVIVDGLPTNAPEELGYLPDGRLLGIHTHDASGVVHLHRRPDQAPYRLEQVLALWGIPRSRTRLGALAIGDGSWTATLWVNGRKAPHWTHDVPLANCQDVQIELRADGIPSRSAPQPLFPFARYPELGDNKCT